MIKSIVLEGIIFLYVVPSFYLFCKDMQKEKDKETAARAAQIKAEKEAARQAGKQIDDE